MKKNNDRISFRPETDMVDNNKNYENSDNNVWKLIIADDDEDVHFMTRIVLDEFTFDNKKLNIIDTYSAEQTKQVLLENPDTALILLDVVMETNDAGLRLVEYIRNTLKNELIRIILRTGYPGEAPENKVLDHYKINDYKEKNELTSLKLYTSIKSALRSYIDLIQINKNLKEIKTLNKEIHHRVKNNLQIMLGLIRIEKQKSRDDYHREMFEKLSNRIFTMATIHEMSYHSELLSEVNIDEQAERIVRNLINTYRQSKDIYFSIEIDKELYLDIYIAIPLGLIINELITNSIKHAFENILYQKKIVVKLFETDGNLKLLLNDNGIDFPEDFDINDENNIGMHLIKILTNHIKGNISINKTKPGKTICINFRANTHPIDKSNN